MRFRAKPALSTVAVGALVAMTAACGGGSASKVNVSATSGCDKNQDSPGITKDSISLGATMPLTGSGGAGGQGVSEAAKAYFGIVNEQGGIQGHKIKYTALDDQYTPSVAQQAMRQLVQRDDIFAVAGGEGTPNFLATVPYINQQKVPAIAPYAPSSQVGTMKTPYVYMTSVNYITEFQIMTKYIVDHYKPKSMSLVGVSGNVGDDAKAGMEKGLAGTGIKVQYLPEQPGTSDFTPIATSLKQHNSDWVFLIITNTDTGQLLKTMQRIGYTPHTAAWPGMGDESYIKAFGDVSNGMIVAEETASLTSNNPKVQEFVKTFTQRVGHAPTKFDELGWVEAEVVTEALKKAPALTRSCLIQSLNTMKGFDTGILPAITFGPNNRQGVNAVGLTQIKDGKLVELTPFQSVTG
jgi:ABC-type branched-subunit amino acid transport system substrate-binding protein